MQKVQNIYRLKITGLTIFVLAAVIGVYVLWPAKSPDVRQIPQQDTSTSAIQPSIEKQQPKRQLTPDDFQTSATTRLQDRNPREQELRDRAALLSSLYRNPDTPDAAKARESLLKPPQGQFAPFRKANDFKFMNVPQGNNTKKTHPKPSPQDDKQADANVGQVSRQYPVNPEREAVKESSESIIQRNSRERRIAGKGNRANALLLFAIHQPISQAQRPSVARTILFLCA